MSERDTLTQEIDTLTAAVREALRQRIVTASFDRPPIDRRIEQLQRRLFATRKQLEATTADPPTLPKTHDQPLVFLSYHRADRPWLDRLMPFLDPVVGRQMLIWDDSRMAPGDPWRRPLEQALAQAKVVILLVSADYLASDFILQGELPLVLQGTADVLPLIVSPCRFQRTSLARYQSINAPSSPLTSKSQVEQDHIFRRAANLVAARLRMDEHRQESIQA